MSEETLFEFPCEFPIKIMGLADETFELAAYEIVRRHVGELKEDAISTRPSKNGKYLAITIKFTAHSKQQLDDLYMELTSHEAIMTVL